MSTTQAPDPAYTLEQAQQDVAGLRGQLAQVQDIISTVSDKALLLYAPDAHAIPRGPTSWSFEDGTVQGWAANSGGAVSNSVVSAAGWPTDGTHSLLLTANGSGAPAAFSPTPVGSFIPSQPGDPVAFHMDIYTPAAVTNVYVGIKWRDDTGGLISEVDSTPVNFGAGQVQTLYFSGIAPDLCAGFAIVFGSTTVLANATLIYGDNIQVQGNLAISASPGGGTDSVGNPYDAGFEVQVEKQGAFRVKGILGQYIVMQVANGVPFLNLSTGVSEEAQSANLQAFVSNPGAGEQMSSFFAGAQGTVHNDRVAVALNSAPKSGGVAGGSLEYIDTGGIVRLPLNWNNLGVKLQSQFANDSTTYQPERYTATLVNNVVINTVGGLFVFSGQTLGVGTYRIRGQVYANPTVSGGTVLIQIAGGAAVAAFMGIDFVEYLVQNGSALGNVQALVALGTNYTSSAIGAGLTDRIIRFDGVIKLTTAGTFGLLCANGGAGSYNVLRTGTYLEILPIGP